MTRKADLSLLQLPLLFALVLSAGMVSRAEAAASPGKPARHKKKPAAAAPAPSPSGGPSGPVMQNFSSEALKKQAPRRNIFSLAVGARGLSGIARRGATLYDSPQLYPFIYIGAFDHRIQFLVNSLELVDYLPVGDGDMIRARTKLASVTDRPLFKTGEPTGIRNSRRNSYEWTTTLETFLPGHVENGVELDLQYSKDLKAHSGSYLEATPRITLARLFLLEGRPRIQPQAFFTVGWGDAHHNLYQYGKGAGVAGFNNIAYGLMVISPTMIDSHYPTLVLSRYQVIGDANKAGSLVADKTSGFQVQALYSFTLFPK